MDNKTKIKLKVEGLANAQIKSGVYALILSEDGPRKMPVVVGLSEAQSIAIAIENVHPPRPMTHDLFVSFARAFDIRLIEVLIYRFEDGIYYSEIVCSDGFHEMRIDSRTSDAVAIALRMNCNIYTYESIIEQCGIVMKENDIMDKAESLFDKYPNPSDMSNDDMEKLHEWLRLLQKSEIEERMTKVIEDENYELANIYKEELLRRQQEGDNS